MSDFPSLDDLSAFCAVCDDGNVSRAAVRLGVAQSTVSSMVARLEGRLGHDLTVRTKSGVEPTRTGQILYEEAKKLVSGWQHAQNRLAEAEMRVAGHFSLLCNPSAGMLLLPHALQTLTSKFPYLRLSIDTELKSSVIDAVESRRVDFGMSTSIGKNARLSHHLLLRTRVGFWAQPDLHIIPETPLIYDPGLSGRDIVYKAAHRLGLHSTRDMRVGNLDLACALAEAGAGVAILPDLVPNYRHSKLIQVHPKVGATVELNLVWRQDLGPKRSVQAIVSALTAQTAVRGR